jgi:rod shape-determining protein MreC
MYRRSGRGRLLLLVFLALSIVVITLDFRQNPGGPLERIKDISSAVLAPIQRGLAAVARPIGDFFSAIGDLGDLRDRNEDLESENERLRSEIEGAEAIEQEYSQIREHFELEASWLTMNRVVAEVIGRMPTNYRWAYIINKGRSDGIRPDMAVIDPNGLVGKVLNATSQRATILVLIDPEAGASARIKEARDTGIVRGNGAGEPLDLQLVGPNAEVLEGDEVITSGYDQGIFPAGIPIGFVSEVGPEGTGLERDIEIEPYVDFTNLDFVEILIDSGPHLTETEEEKLREAAGGQ